MLINHRYRFVYLAAPRTASTSIRQWLSVLPHTELINDQHRMQVPADCLRYYCWSTFRHPGERALSLWGYHQQDPDRRSLDDYARDLRTMHPFHRRSQLEWFATSNAQIQPLLLGGCIEGRIIRHVFRARGFAEPELPSMPTANAAAHPRWDEIPQAVRQRIAYNWADDFQAWLAPATASPIRG